MECKVGEEHESKMDALSNVEWGRGTKGRRIRKHRGNACDLSTLYTHIRMP